MSRMRSYKLTGFGAPLAEAIESPPAPKGAEVLLRVSACGVCHSDLHAIDGLWPQPAPSVLGHEGAGIVEKVGSAVNYVKPGDHVISCAMVFCGYCEDCLAGDHHLCNNRAATRRPKSGPPRLSQGGKKM